MDKQGARQGRAGSHVMPHWGSGPAAFATPQELPGRGNPAWGRLSPVPTPPNSPELGAPRGVTLEAALPNPLP